MTAHPTLALNDGRAIPQLGLGVWQVPDDQAAMAVAEALRAGYRLIDTAAIYENERGVGEGLRAAGLPREEVYVTTKLWNDDQGYDETLRACEASLGLLGLDYVDLYLIHWPVPAKDRYVDSWRALLELRRRGLARSVGVSNFHPHHLARVIEATGVVPAVNQVELHPYLQQRELRAVHAEHGILTESWSPLAQGEALADPVVAGIAAKHGKSAAQVVIRWHLDRGLVVIPKSVTPARIRENAAVFDFALDAGDLAKLDGLNADRRVGPDPEHFDP